MVLPGIIAPAATRYGPLVERLADVDVVVRDLAVYDDDEPPGDYSINTEVDALDDAAGFTRFHLYGHSAGGAVALAHAVFLVHRTDALSRDGRYRDGRLPNEAAERPQVGAPNAVSASLASRLGKLHTVSLGGSTAARNRSASDLLTEVAEVHQRRLAVGVALVDLPE
jgi:pimeloyl-ACP methyl ester carboxylesterase